MTYTEIIGNLKDIDPENRTVDSVSIDWFEAFNKIHRKVSQQGEDIKIRLGEDVLVKGIRDGDILSINDSQILIVKILPAKAILARVAENHLKSIAKLCYEVGNTHTSMFYGDTPYEYLIPYSKALADKLTGIHGVTLEKVETVFDFDRALSNSINDHHH